VEVILVIIPDVETRLFVVQLINRRLVLVAFVKTILPLVKFKIVPLVEVMVGLLSVPIEAELDTRDVEVKFVLMRFVFIKLDSVDVVETKEVVVIPVDVNLPEVIFCVVKLLLDTLVYDALGADNAAKVEVPSITMLPTVISPLSCKFWEMNVFPPIKRSLDIAAPPKAVRDPPVPIPEELVVLVILTVALAVKVPDSNNNESMEMTGLVPLPAIS
jgi:hypothetical protein